jgi:hypothetical protein
MKTIFLTSGSTWTVPSDWDASSATIEAIGAGGNGAAGSTTAGGGGGGGGAYAAISAPSNINPGDVLSIQIGAAGGGPGSTGDSWLKDNTSTIVLRARAGTNGANTGAGGGSGGGAGGDTANSVGSTKFAGGTGGGSSRPAVAAAARLVHLAQASRVQQQTPPQMSAARAAAARTAEARAQAVGRTRRTAAMAAMEMPEPDMALGHRPLVWMEVPERMAAAAAADRSSATRHQVVALAGNRTSGRKPPTVRLRGRAAAVVRARAMRPESHTQKAVQAEAMAAAEAAVAVRAAISRAAPARKASSSSPIRRALPQQFRAASAS